MRNKIVLLDIDDTLFNTEQFIKSDLSVYELYEEVLEALSGLEKIATLGVFSQGELAFQKKKLYETNIENYFSEEHLHIVAFKRSVIHDFLREYIKQGKLYIIDDRLENLSAAKQQEPSVFTIWMKRGRYADVQEQKSDLKPDAVISNLREAIPLIKST